MSEYLISNSEATNILLESLGIYPDSFWDYVEWVLSRQLVSEMVKQVGGDRVFFEKPDAMRCFRELLRVRTGRRWPLSDVEKIMAQVRLEIFEHFRDPIEYGDYLKLIWTVPQECAMCRMKPPQVVLHIDHVLPASRGGGSKAINLQFLCSKHNLEKSNKLEETERWLNYQ